MIKFLKVYIETTIVSYLTARPSRDLIIAAHQQITNEWWENRRDDFDLYVAARHGMDYLLTWNCKHIANAEMQAGIGKLCRAAGFEPPVICTPEELLGS